MSYLEDRAKKKAETAEKNAQESIYKKDEWLATMSNPDSNIDELGKIVRWIILPLFCAWVWYIGFIFTQNELTGVVEPWQVTLLAFLLPGTIQFLKLYGAKKALRAFHFKWYDRTGHDFWLWSLVAIVVVLMFAWSLKISIFDVKDTAIDNYTTSNTDSLNVLLAAATADVDNQINALNESNKRAGSMKTKKGKISWSGQSIEMNNSATLSTLHQQKNEIVSQTIADYKSGKIKVEKDAAGRGSFFRRFGGFGEAGEILFCLILGLIEAINRNSNISRLSKGKNDMHEDETALKSQQTQPVFRNGHTFNTPKNTIGFHWPGYGQQNTVSQPTFTVSQQTQPNSTLGSDAVLKVCKKALQSDMPNFKRQDVKKKSVSERINAALDACFNEMNNPDFCPSMPVAADFYRLCVEDVFPQLNEKGWPYERDTFFLKRLLAVIPKVEQV